MIRGRVPFRAGLAGPWHEKDRLGAVLAYFFAPVIKGKACRKSADEMRGPETLGLEDDVIPLLGSQDGFDIRAFIESFQFGAGLGNHLGLDAEEGIGVVIGQPRDNGGHIVKEGIAVAHE